MNYFQPGMPASQPSGGAGLDWIMQRFQNIERQLRELGPSVADSVRPMVEDLAAKQAALEAAQTTLTTQQSALEAAQATLTTQQSALEDIVEKQVEFGSTGGTSTAFALSTTSTPLRSATIAVPDGYTRGIVLAVAVVGAWNGTASDGFLYARVKIDTAAGAEGTTTTKASTYGLATVSAVRTFTGLTPGATISLAAEGKASTAWASNGSNLANLDAIALFRR